MESEYLVVKSVQQQVFKNLYSGENGPQVLRNIFPEYVRQLVSIISTIIL